MGPRDPGETALELLLTTRWMLATGRRIHERPSLHHLSAEQLIDFWADHLLAGADLAQADHRVGGADLAEGDHLLGGADRVEAE